MNTKAKHDMDYGQLGDLLFEDNEEFRQKTKSCYLTKKGFSYHTILEMQQNANKVAESFGGSHHKKLSKEEK